MADYSDSDIMLLGERTAKKLGIVLPGDDKIKEAGAMLTFEVRPGLDSESEGKGDTCKSKTCVTAFTNEFGAKLPGK